ncbi:MAG: hypothetical protein ACLVJ8_06640 [Ruthenibacterium lactatiformans]
MEHKLRITLDDDVLEGITSSPRYATASHTGAVPRRPWRTCRTECWM